MWTFFEHISIVEAMLFTPIIQQKPLCLNKDYDFLDWPKLYQVSIWTQMSEVTEDSNLGSNGIHRWMFAIKLMFYIYMALVHLIA